MSTRIVDVYPGDTIIIALSAPLPESEVTSLHAAWKPLTEGGIKVAFVEDAQSIIIARSARGVS